MNPLLAEGLTDAVGFVGGSLAGYWLAYAFGFNPFVEAMDGNSVIGILACGIGGGAGVQIGRRLRASMLKKEAD
jgi:hypothetical protein